MKFFYIESLFQNIVKKGNNDTGKIIPFFPVELNRQWEEVCRAFISRCPCWPVLSWVLPRSLFAICWALCERETIVVISNWKRVDNQRDVWWGIYQHSTDKPEKVLSQKQATGERWWGFKTDVTGRYTKNLIQFLSKGVHCPFHTKRREIKLET